MSDVVRLTLRGAIDHPIEIDGLTPDRTATLSQSDIAALPVLVGSQRAALGDFFTVHGERSDRLHIEGDVRNIDGLGAGTAGGELLIEGSAGHRVGAGMTGGRIDVRGSVGDDAGLGMQGGALRITGDAGNRLGAASAGASKGMSGGEIVVNGSAGSDAAARVRRGLIVVGADVGADPARAIIAGTLLVFGRTGANPGRGSKRGTIVALGEIEIPSTYEYACTYQPTYVRMLLTYVHRRYGLASPEGSLDGSYARYCGDGGHPGKGEILAYTPAVMRTILPILVGVLILLNPARALAACADLSRLNLPHTTVTRAEVVAPGALTVQGVPQTVSAQLPEFCRIAATLRPSADSDIKIEVWLPAAWNGRFQAVGNGGWAGNVPYAAMAAAVGGGYAAAGTDTGHTGGTAAFAIGHPEKVIDLGYRSVHEMTAQAKSLINAFYGRAPQFSIWNGCSQGGRQGITEAVRYPTDFDGVIAGAPAVNWMNLHAGRMAANRAANRSEVATIPPDKYVLVHDAVMNACDMNDGVKDGLIENPLSCRFDPQVLACKGADTANCLTAPQVESARALYASALDPKTGQEVLPGLAPGSELAWATAASARPVSTALDAFKYIVFENPNWDPATFNPATDIERTLHADRNDVLNSSSTDLKAFFDRGGKLLMYHGWSDTQVTPLNSINYFHAVVSRFGPQAVGSSIQLYMVPGMYHCNGGAGTDVFNKVGALEQWMTTGAAPEKIVASHLTNLTIDRTRPLCTFGHEAKWTGAGSFDEAANFACVAAPVSPAR